MKTFKQYVSKREHVEDATDHDNDKGDRESTRQKMVQIAKVICHKHPKLMMGLFEKVAEQDSEIRSSVEDLKRNLSGSSLGSDRGLGDLGNGRGDEVMPNAADSQGGDNSGEE
jgi:hypothetical protein